MNLATTAAATTERSREILHDPWTQAILTGALTLIPARNYPRWLRQSLIWAPVVIGIVGASCLGANPHARHKLLERLGVSDLTPAVEQSPQQLPPQRPRQPESWRGLRAAVAGGTIGAVVSCGMAVGLWSDEKLERGLSRLKVPFPRVVMAVAVGGMTWWQVNQEQRKH